MRLLGIVLERNTLPLLGLVTAYLRHFFWSQRCLVSLSFTGVNWCLLLTVQYCTADTSNKQVEDCSGKTDASDWTLYSVLVERDCSTGALETPTHSASGNA